MRKTQKPVGPLKALKLSQLKARQPKKRKYTPLAKKTAQQLVRVADEAFSKYVRLRDSTFVQGSFHGQCITCSRAGEVAWFDSTNKLRFNPGWDAGHFMSRGEKVTRFDEENVNLQCAYRCNRLRSGEHEKYRLALDVKYGSGTAEKLEKLARETKLYKFSKPELMQIIQDSQKRITWYADNH